MGFAKIQLIRGPRINRPTLSVVQGAQETFEVTITDENGAPINLTDYDNTIAPQPTDGDEVVVECQAGNLPLTHGISFIIAEFQGQIPQTLCTTAKVVDAKKGILSVTFNTCDFGIASGAGGSSQGGPGLFLGEFLFIKDGVLDMQFCVFVEIVPSLTWHVVKNEPLSISEIRLWARDSIPGDNFLLDELEYKDAEIFAAIRRGIDMWNSTTPIMSQHMHTVFTFPSMFRSAWIEVTIGFLMRIASQSYMRNHLPYQAAGLSVDDKKKFEWYAKEGLARIEAFKEWAKDVKIQLNAQQLWGRSAIYHPGSCHGGTAGRFTYSDYFDY